MAIPTSGNSRLPPVPSHLTAAAPAASAVPTASTAAAQKASKVAKPAIKETGTEVVSYSANGLLESIRKGDTPKALKMIQNATAAQLDTRGKITATELDSFLFTALELAYFSQHNFKIKRDPAIVNAILDKGVDPGIQDQFSESVLKDAVGESGKSPQNEAFALRCIEQANAKWFKDISGGSLLYQVIYGGGSKKVARALLARGADPRISDSRGLSSMLYAVREGREDITKIFEEHIAAQGKESAAAPKGSSGNPSTVMAQPKLQEVQSVGTQVVYIEDMSLSELITTLDQLKKQGDNGTINEQAKRNGVIEQLMRARDNKIVKATKEELSSAISAVNSCHGQFKLDMLKYLQHHGADLTESAVPPAAGGGAQPGVSDKKLESGNK